MAANPPPPPGGYAPPPPQYGYPPYQGGTSPPYYPPPGGAPPGYQHHRGRQDNRASGNSQNYQQPSQHRQDLKPSNCLYVRNIPFQLPPEEFHKIFSQFGEIAISVTNRIHDKGVAFVTYYDRRAAQEAVDQMYGKNVMGRIPITTFSYKPPTYSGIDARATCLKVLLRPAQPIDQPSIVNAHAVMSTYGEIANEKEVEKGHFEFEFFDTRSVKKVVDNTGQIVIDGIKWYADMVIDRDEGGMAYAPGSHQNRQMGRNPPPPAPYGMAPLQYPPAQHQMMPPQYAPQQQQPPQYQPARPQYQAQQQQVQMQVPQYPAQYSGQPMAGVPPPPPPQYTASPQTTVNVTGMPDKDFSSSLRRLMNKGSGI